MKSIALLILLLCLAKAFNNQGYSKIKKSISPVGKEILNPHIVNGQPAQPYQFPFMAALLFLDGRNSAFLCGGTLISNEWVLTAAHCIYRRVSVQVNLGSINRLYAQLHYNVQRNDMIMHNEFNYRAQKNDIGLIRLYPPVRRSQAVAPIGLPRAGFQNEVGAIATAMGWGALYTNGNLSDTLMYTEGHVISQAQCRRYPGFASVDNNELCTLPAPGAICTGDSGGPLVLRSSQVIIGVISNGPDSGCLTGSPDVYTRVASYLHWIESITGVTP